MSVGGSTSEYALKPKVGDALLDDPSVVDIMQHPKVAAGIAKLKDDPSCFKDLMQDEETARLFGKLQQHFSEKESEVAVQEESGQAAREDTHSTSGENDDAPPLQDSDSLEAEQARAEGANAFAGGDFVDACRHYERAVKFEPEQHIHWTNLSVARLRAGMAAAAADAAHECIRLNPRFAKGYLRLGDARCALRQHVGAKEAYNNGLQRAEGPLCATLKEKLRTATLAVEAAAAAAAAAAGSEHPAAADSQHAKVVDHAAHSSPAASPGASAPMGDAMALSNAHIFDIL